MFRCTIDLGFGPLTLTFDMRACNLEFLSFGLRFG
jgi:hypothetical protein